MYARRHPGSTLLFYASTDVFLPNKLPGFESCSCVTLSDSLCLPFFLFLFGFVMSVPVLEYSLLYGLCKSVARRFVMHAIGHM